MEDDTEIQSQSLLPVIKQYESAIETLTTQIEFYANEQERLRQEIEALVAENKSLSRTVKELLDSQSNTCRESNERRLESELVENLKNQLSLTLKEKDTVVQLWQTALRNIDHLEEELKLFEGRTHGYFSKPEVVKIKQKYENQVRELEEQLVGCQAKLDMVLKSSAKSLENKNADLEKALESQNNTGNLVKRLEDEVHQLQNKVKEIMTMRDELQRKVEAKNDLIEELKIKDIQARAKVTEAIQIVEAAFFEKDAALLRENEAKEEVVKISKTMSEIIDEAAEKVKSEIAKVKQEHSTKLVKIEQSMENLKKELSAKNAELEKYVRECKLLEEELQRIKSGNIFIEDSSTSKLLILENKLESTFQKLLLSERKNLQVTAEKESIKTDMQQMADCFENDIKMREIEKQVLRHEADNLRKQLKISRSNLIQVAGEIDKLNSKIKLLETDIRDKLLQKDVMFQEVLTKTIHAVENKNMEVQSELQKQLAVHVRLNTRWKKEMQEVIDKFEVRMTELKEVNKSLRTKLKNAVDESLQHKRNLTDICKDVTSITNVTQNVSNKK